MEVLRHVWANYRDDSFIAQFLSPRLIRNWRLFHVVDDREQPHLEVAAIHNERGYRDLRRSLAAQYEVGDYAPDIQIVDVDLAGNRKLVLHHRVRDGKMLELSNASMVLGHLANLWGYEVLLQEIDASSEQVLKEHMVRPENG
jgi:spore cortex formation protein SpoVR/YcgB (stage V sporulation)